MYKAVFFAAWCVAFSRCYQQGFVFPNTNVIYGTNLPQTINIHGKYNVDTTKPPFIQTRSTSNELLFTGPHLCTTEIEKRMQEMTVTNHERIDLLIRHIKYDIVDAGEVQIRPAVNTTGCVKLDLVEYPPVGSGIYNFSVSVNFTNFGPVLFVDAFGIEAFHYMQKEKHGLTVEHTLSYCPPINTRTSLREMLTVEPRPVCPSMSSKKRTRLDGMITVYKKTRSVVKSPAHACYKENTKIWTTENFFGARDHSELNPKDKAVPIDLCQEFLDRESCFLCHPRDGCKRFNMKERSVTMKSTNKKAYFEYKWPTSNDYTISNCFLESGSVETYPPFDRLNSPWSPMPSELLNKTSYVLPSGEKLITWEAFDPSELCLYEPSVTLDVHKLVFKTKERLAMDPNPNATQIVSFLAKDIAAMWQTDDTLKLTNETRFKCVKMFENSEMYMTVRDEIIVFTPNVSVHKDANKNDKSFLGGSGSKVVFHPHHSFRKIEIDPKGQVTDSKTHLYDNIPFADDSQDVITNAVNDEDLEDHGDAEFQYPQINDANVQLAIDYIRTEQTNERITTRALNTCYQNQLAWDNFVYAALQTDPSRMFTLKLGYPVRAEHVGNLFYTYTRCHPVRVKKVIPTLFTNSTLMVEVNGNSTSMSEIVRRMGVVPDNLKCILQPLVVITDIVNEREYVGQIQKNNQIDLDRIWLSERCYKGSFIPTLIEDRVYVFSDYDLSTTIDYDLIHRYTSSATTSHGMYHQTLRFNPEELEVIRNNKELLDYLKVVRVTKTLEERPEKELDTGFTVDESLKMWDEMARTRSSLYDLEAWLTYDKMGRANFTRETLLSATDGGGGPNPLGDLLNKGANVVEGVAESAGGIVGGLFRGVSSIFGGIFDFIKNPFETIITIAVIIFAVVILVYIIRRYISSKPKSE